MLGLLSCGGALFCDGVWQSLCLTSVPGNDLGRVLRWGAGYSGEDPLSVLVSVDEADAVLMDRWTILLDAQEASSAESSAVDTEPPKVPVCPCGALEWLLECVKVLLSHRQECWHPTRKARLLLQASGAVGCSGVLWPKKAAPGWQRDTAGWLVAW